MAIDRLATLRGRATAMEISHGSGTARNDTETESYAIAQDWLPSAQTGIVGQGDPRSVVASIQTGTSYRNELRMNVFS